MRSNCLLTATPRKNKREKKKRDSILHISTLAVYANL